MACFRFLFSLLIHVSLPGEPLAAVCSLLKSACFYQNTQGVSTEIQNVTKRDIFPQSCVSFCAKTDRCLGVNEVIDTGICQIVEENDIISGLEWHETHGYNFWSFEHPCPKVRFSYQTRTITFPYHGSIFPVWNLCVMIIISEYA